MRRGQLPIVSPPQFSMESDAPESLGSEYTVVAPDPDAIFFRPPCLDDLPALLALETASYPPDEAATREKLAMRIEDAADVFMVAMRPADSAIVGFVCGTCTAAAGLTHESMSTHDPEGQLLCVHRQVQLLRGGAAERSLASRRNNRGACDDDTKSDRRPMNLIIQPCCMSDWGGPGPPVPPPPREPPTSLLPL